MTSVFSGVDLRPYSVSRHRCSYASLGRRMLCANAQRYVELRSLLRLSSLTFGLIASVNCAFLTEVVGGILLRGRVDLSGATRGQSGGD
jgi:hypothetical protein